MFCLLVAVQDGQYAWMAGGQRTFGGLGASLAPTQCTTDHFCPVVSISAAGPAARAGVVEGDKARLDHRTELYRSLSVGDRVGMTVRHGGSERHLVLQAEPFHPPPLNLYIVTACFLALLALTAALIAAKAANKPVNLLLATATASYAIPGSYPRLWQNWPGLFHFFFLLLTFLVILGPIVMAAAMQRFRLETTGRESRLARILFWPVTAVVLLGTALGMYIAMNAAPLLGISDGLSLTSIMWAVGSLLAPLPLVIRWDQVPANQRTRYAFVAAAVVALAANAWIDPVIMLTTNDYNQASWPVVVQMTALSSAGFLFAYAILRHRVIDLGFAINRTLVYSLLSAVLLAGFALAEKAAEQLLPERAHHADVLVQAFIALAIFAVFHRLRDAVENVVDRLFFADWRRSEARLTRFVHQARFITKPARLVERTIEEIEAYAGGAEVAVYQLGDGAYHRVGGGVAGVARRVDIDAPALVALRADGELQHGGLGGAALLLPMVQRGEVSGFVAVGAKRDGAHYRPDEEAQLAAAAQNVGLDLHALKLEQIQAANRRLTNQMAALLPAA